MAVRPGARCWGHTPLNREPQALGETLGGTNRACRVVRHHLAGRSGSVSMEC